MWGKKKTAYRRLYLFQECIPGRLKRDRLQKLQESARCVEHRVVQPDAGLLESLSGTSAICTHPSLLMLGLQGTKKTVHTHFIC